MQPLGTSGVNEETITSDKDKYVLFKSFGPLIQHQKKIESNPEKILEDLE